MHLKFHSPVIITDQLDQLKYFYSEVLQLNIEFDFGNCIGFKDAMSIWTLQPNYPITKALGYSFSPQGNKNMELCFESDDFELIVNNLKKHQIKYLHETVEENWGQLTVRFYDPDNNLVEIGESMKCFVNRFYKRGMSVNEITEKTSIPLKVVEKLVEH